MRILLIVCIVNLFFFENLFAQYNKGDVLLSGNISWQYSDKYMDSRNPGSFYVENRIDNSNKLLYNITGYFSLGVIAHNTFLRVKSRSVTRPGWRLVSVRSLKTGPLLRFDKDISKLNLFTEFSYAPYVTKEFEISGKRKLVNQYHGNSIYAGLGVSYFPIKQISFDAVFSLLRDKKHYYVDNEKQPYFITDKYMNICLGISYYFKTKKDEK